MCTLLFSLVTGVILQHVDAHGSSSAPLGVEVISGLVRQDDFVPSRRFHEDGREASKLATGGRTRINTLGAPAVAKRTKPGNPLPVQVEPVVPIPCTKQNNADFGDHALHVEARPVFK